MLAAVVAVLLELGGIFTSNKEQRTGLQASLEENMFLFYSRALNPANLATRQ